MAAEIANNPFADMYEMFSLFGQQADRWGRKFVPISAGVNWCKPSPAALQLAALELEHAVTTRNYGNAGGSPPITAALAIVERRLHVNRELEVTLTHGATEGATLVLEYWKRTGAMCQGDTMLTIGPAFALYNRLASDFGLAFYQVLGAANASDAFMPSVDQIEEALAAERPQVIVVLLPNNPLGEFVDEAGLQRICHYASSTGARILVDRVCLMPWDDVDTIARALGPLIAAGQAAVVDSLSKSESLAGLRSGYLVSDAATKAGVVELIKSRFLNPPVFPTATLAALRLAHFDLRLATHMGRLFEKASAEIFSEYPGEEDFRDFLRTATALLPALRAGMAERRRVLIANHAMLCATFTDRLARPLLWQGGFNVALATADMDAAREIADGHALACDRGIGVLTSRCFGAVDGGRLYFVRVGLSLSEADFTEGVARLAAFYDRDRVAV
jgi:aspartate/methionine/tyrosine aminotransferase